MELTELRNIGKEISFKLHSIGISTAEELNGIGCKQAFKQLKVEYSNVCLVHLFVLYGVINNVEYSTLSTHVKKDIKAYSDSLEML